MPTAATTTATVITWAIAVGIILLGTRFLWAPQRAAADFGLPTTHPTPAVSSWLSVKGVRDICSGLFLLIVLLGGDTHLRGWMMLAGSLIALGDAFTVKRGGGPATAYYGIHGGTAAVMAAAGITLLLS
ncbi:DUF4267 domain-containing protein [Streptomyces griseoluteus]|uniref:DUF4267 domain-containing protein n=1 Tax=Streptomyces griseoluteus TaxID=29306 RepID=A0A4Z1DBR1_STRGP|nr:DUF4267 domain-containing protein [Streptomyces griseoluteus]TGN79989.1 DUF4267 domain-containing protein [Streptomyces griseoluteus]GHF32130.1 membrane protein [Streptomyces griseoluteus]